MNRYNQMKREKKKSNKNDVNNKPRSFNELIEEAISQEEKGERYVDGLKARRYYEASCEYYEKANKLQENDFSCIYNWARVTYILATFTNPSYGSQKKINLLQQSIGRFRKAIEINNEACDALFNLKQALSSFGEICLDEISEQAAIPYFKEAIEIADRLYELQKEIYNKSKEDDNMISKSEQPEEGEAMDTVEMDAEEIDNVNINSIIETLTSQAEDLINLSGIMDNEGESQVLFDEALNRLRECERMIKIEEDDRKKQNDTNSDHMDDDDDIEEIDINSVDSAYSSVLSSRAEHLFSTNGIYEPTLFEDALHHQDLVLSRIPESSNSQVVYQQRAQELCNKADIMCNFAEAMRKNNEKLDENSPSQNIYQQAYETYKTALKYETSNQSIHTKIGDMCLILANNYKNLISQASENDQNSYKQKMLTIIRQGLDIYKEVLRQHQQQQIQVEPEIYLRIAKGLSYFCEDNMKMKQCQGMLQKFVQSGGCLETVVDDLEIVNFDFSTEVLNQQWFVQGMSQI